jgi:putative membrane protein
MKARIVALVSAGALISAAYAQSVPEKTGLNAALGITPKTEDFIKEAAMNDMLEIESAKIAREKGNPKVKEFAEMLITDHTKANAELRELLPTDMKSFVPGELDSNSQKKVDKLREIRKQAFGPEYDRMQVSVHRDAVNLFERYAKGGQDPRLKEWAEKILPTLRHHSEMAQNLKIARR